MSENEMLKKILEKIESSDRIARSPYLTFKEACTYLGVSKTQLYRLMFERQVTYSKPSGKIAYFKREDLEDYLTRNTVPSFASLEGLASDHVVSTAV